MKKWTDKMVKRHKLVECPKQNLKEIPSDQCKGCEHYMGETGFYINCSKGENNG